MKTKRRKVYDTMKLEKYGDGLVTTPDFWDCECEHNYIHPKTKESCPLCKTHKDDQPDSRADEVCDKFIEFIRTA